MTDRTIRELIHELEKYDQNTPVYFRDHENGKAKAVPIGNLDRIVVSEEEKGFLEEEEFFYENETTKKWNAILLT